MTSKYSVVQFVPDPITDERINIGVIVFDKIGVQVQFLKSWERVKRFANNDVQFLQEFAENCMLAASPNLLLEFDMFPKLDEKKILAMAKNWRNSIQITQPRGSLKDVEALRKEVASRFLVEQTRGKKDYKDKMAAAKIARQHIRKELHNRFEPNVAGDLLRTHDEIEGANKFHTFDAIVRNGAPYFIVEALSFELPKATHLDLQIDAKAWAFTDVKANNPEIPIGIFTLPPISRDTHINNLYRSTVKTYTNIGVDVLTENDFVDWSTRLIAAIRLDH